MYNIFIYAFSKCPVCACLIKESSVERGLDNISCHCRLLPYNMVTCKTTFGDTFGDFLDDTFFFVFLIFYLFIYLEKGEGREKEREKNFYVREKQLPLSCPPTGDLAGHPGMCPDPELNQQPFAFRDDTQPPEPHQSGLDNIFLKGCC